MITRLLSPREILIGGGSRFSLPSVLQPMGARRPLIVADPTMLRLGHAEALQEALADAGLAASIFAEVVEDPTDVSVTSLAERIVEGRHDALVALGGGSAIDTTKAAAILVATGKPLSELKVPKVNDIAVMPLVAIPTTAGTGSEVTRAAVITDTASQEKMLIVGIGALPSVAIVDYELTLTCPRRVTIDTGIDAMTHAIEAFVNRKATRHSDALALSALQLIGANLRRVVAVPDDRQAREGLMLGALQAGQAMCNSSTALIHGLSRPIGAFFHVPHGMSNAMVLPLVTQFSLGAAPEKYAAIARALGVAPPSATDEAAGLGLVEAFVQLNIDLEVPTPEGFGIDRHRYAAMLPEMVRQGLASGTPMNNPRVATEAEMSRLYELAYDGRLEAAS